MMKETILIATKIILFIPITVCLFIGFVAMVIYIEFTGEKDGHRKNKRNLKSCKVA